MKKKVIENSFPNLSLNSELCKLFSWTQKNSSATVSFCIFISGSVEARHLPVVPSSVLVEGIFFRREFTNCLSYSCSLLSRHSEQTLQQLLLTFHTPHLECEDSLQ
jgi:hypothetical protein